MTNEYMDNKNEYLNTIDNESSKTMYRNYFNLINETEVQIKKDLKDFSRSEIETALEQLNIKTLSTCRTVYNLIVSYISWAIDNNLTNSNINPLDRYPYTQMFLNIRKDVPAYITPDMLMEIINQSPNYSDSLMLYSLYRGIDGASYSEIGNMKLEDIDETNKTITVYDGVRSEENARIVPIDEYFITLANKADTQEVLQMWSSNRSQKLYKSDYLFKPITARSGIFNNRTAYNRIGDIGRFFGEEFNFLTLNNIKKHGKFDLIIKLLDKYGEVNKNFLEEYNQYFPLPVVNGSYLSVSQDISQAMLMIDELRSAYQTSSHN